MLKYVLECGTASIVLAGRPDCRERQHDDTPKDRIVYESGLLFYRLRSFGEPQPASTGIYRADPVGRMYAAALVAFDPDVPNRGPTRHLAIPASTAATLGIPTNCKADGVAPLADCGEPVSPGVILQIFVTGLGKATPGGDPAGDPLPTGELAPGGYNTVETPVVTIGGVQAIVDFSGLAPSFSGLYQINARVPFGALPGDQVPLTIRMPSEAEGDTSNIAIAGP